MMRKILVGAAAGAAGTTALNTITYLDMTWRGRPASSTPEKLVEAVADKADLSIPGDGDTRDARLSGLGALSGIVTGIGIGAAYGLLDALGLRPGLFLGSLLTGAAAMAASDGSMAGFGVADPTTWSGSDWASDIIPHFGYGAVLSATYNAAEPR
ncbi:MAG: hypothetical protein ACR2JN_12785 [Lapillicoccus sp.]